MHHVTNRSHTPRNRTDPSVRAPESKTDMRFGTWNVMSHYRSVSLTAAARELARYKLNVLGVQKLTWDKGDTVSVEDYKFVYVKKRKIINWEQDFFTPQNSISS